jgi:hypothetical protein
MTHGTKLDCPINSVNICIYCTIIFNNKHYYTFLLFQEGTSLDHFLKTFQGRTQPFILVLVGDHRNPAQCFVIMERRPYAAATLVKAVGLCYKLYQIFHLEYPTQALAIWQFFDLTVYQVKVEKESGSVRQFRAYILQFYAPSLTLHLMSIQRAL